ncbi:hypothetical protein D9619_004012 [Psilocybe cf. subviscida]|uniref:Enoyl reductase (ER) domain-containing protein n=1 Tax=Psilocybe cf. subviscida TaxID=2480587 RepID=A0A8H5BQR1_9AGAR|nr:hypothetical protein D9619_004012 [Psilocybe cf. subviscida]
MLNIANEGLQYISAGTRHAISSTPTTKSWPLPRRTHSSSTKSSATTSLPISDIPVPKPGDGQVLIKIIATSLNPVDWKIKTHGLFLEKYPAILGTDLAGVVEEVGQGVDEWKHGDRVYIQGQFENDFSSFQQYALALASTLARIPDNVSFDEAATVPVVLTCAFTGLYQKALYGLGLTPPFSPDTRGIYNGTPIVVIGGASSVGQAVIQLARISGLSPIITTASLTNADYLKSLGATHVFDRNISPAALQSEISTITQAPLKYVYDATSLPATQTLGLSILAEGGQLAIVLPLEVALPEGREARHVVGILRLPHQIEFTQTLYHDTIMPLLEKGLFKAHSFCLIVLLLWPRSNRLH